MEYMYKLANLQDYALSHVYENMEMVLYSAVCFFLPFLMGHPQVFVGIMVNAMLITAALNLRNYRVLPAVLLPSLGALSRGAVFGPLSKFLIYFIPFIWAGNAILVFSFKHFRLGKRLNYWATLAIGAILKSGFLFLAALILFKLGIVPAAFLAAMGIMQAVTALFGGAVAYGIHNAKKYASS